jgi:hypothetical protein
MDSVGLRSVDDASLRASIRMGVNSRQASKYANAMLSHFDGAHDTFRDTGAQICRGFLDPVCKSVLRVLELFPA